MAQEAGVGVGVGGVRPLKEPGQSSRRVQVMTFRVQSAPDDQQKIPVSFTSASCLAARWISKAHMSPSPTPPPHPHSPPPLQGQILASSASSCYLGVKGEGLRSPRQDSSGSGLKAARGRKRWQARCIGTGRSRPCRPDDGRMPPRPRSGHEWSF